MVKLLMFCFALDSGNSGQLLGFGVASVQSVEIPVIGLLELEQHIIVPGP